MKKSNLTENTKKVVENFYETLLSRDLDAVANKFSNYVDWSIAGDEELAPWLGRRNNRREIREFFEMLLENIEPVSVEIQHILADGDFAVATGEFASRMLKTGKIYESIFSAHFTVQNDLIVRYRLQEDSHGLVKALTA